MKNKLGCERGKEGERERGGGGIGHVSPTWVL